MNYPIELQRITIYSFVQLLIDLAHLFLLSDFNKSYFNPRYNNLFSSAPNYHKLS